MQRFAADLRLLRRQAGGPSYRELARRSNYSATVLAEAAGGTRLPTLPVTLAYAEACGGEPAEWECRWRAVTAALRRREPRDPAELPAAIDTFVGREPEVARLQAWIEHQGPALRIMVVHGIGGVGKSALAIRVAHRIAEGFPDGQLFAALHGYADGVPPLDPLEVLGRFLRALGMAGREVPATADEAAARYRSMLAGRRVLVVLDNVRDSAQVRPLLPGGPGCAVLITSRTPLLDLDGAGHLHVDVLEPDDAVALLRRLAGHSRIRADPEAATDLAGACGHLPLALRIAGARLASRPSLTVRALADRLSGGTHDRLDELHLGDLAVRTSFRLSYRTLSPELARAYRRLSLLDGPDFGAEVAAAQLGMDATAAEAILERLVGEHLLEEPGCGRYRFHDLLRLFARELAARDEPPAERRAALERVLRCYLATARRAAVLLAPGAPGGVPAAQAEPDPHTEPAAHARQEALDWLEALAWLEAERAGIVAAARRAASGPAGVAGLVPELATALYQFFLVRPHWRDWETLDRLALEVARRAGDRDAEARLLGDLGVVCRKLFRLDDAIAALTESVRIRRDLGYPRGEARTLSSLGMAHFDLRRYGEATACLQRSLELQRETGDLAGEAAGLNNLANILRKTGRTGEALACCERSLAIWRELGDRRREAITACNLGEALLGAGQVQPALDRYEQALAIAREFGDRHGEAYTLVALGEAYRAAGRLDEAVGACEEGLAIERVAAHRWGEGRALHSLGKALHDLGEPQQALARWQEALRCFAEIGAPEYQDVLERLGRARDEA